MKAILGSIALGALLAVPGGGKTPVPGFSAQAPSLAGSWVLNEEASDHPGMPPAAISSPAVGDDVQDDPRATRRGRPAGSIAGVAAPDERRRAQMRETIRIALRYPHSLTIAQDDSSVTFTHPGRDGAPVATVILTNGDKIKEKAGDDLTVESKGEWKNGTLAVERQFTGGGKIVETYGVSEGGQLINEVKVQTRLPGRVEFKLVYDLKNEGGA